MVPQSPVVYKRSTQILQYLVKALATVPNLLRRVCIMLRAGCILRFVQWLRPGNATSRPEARVPSVLHPGSNNHVICPSSLPTQVAEQHPLTKIPSTTVPELCHTTVPSQIGSTHNLSDGSSSVTQVSRVSSPLSHSYLASRHGEVLEHLAQVSPEKKENLVCVNPQEYERYSRTKLEKVETDEYILPPFKRSFTPGGFEVSKPGSKPPHSQSQLPHGWTYHTHPEGAPYFHDNSRRILTDFYLYDDEEYHRAENVIKRIIKYMEDREIPWSSDTELVIEPRSSGNVGYYFADHINQVVFWPVECDIVWELKEVKVHFNETHVGHLIRSYYWRHNELFPHVHKLSANVIDEVSGTLIHAIGDSLTSSVNLSPYSLDDLQNMLQLTHEIEKQRTTQYWVSSAWVLYRLMATFDEQRFLNLHGEKGARLSGDQSIHEATAETLFFKVLSLLLLSAPSTYLRKLQETSVDSLVNKPSWLQLKKKLTEEWKDSALFSTVLLNANVAFLAIQSVDQPSRSNAQRASYISVLTSMGAIIFGLLLTRQHQHIFNMKFLANRGVSVLGFETLALMYSLPYVFLMWGTFSFLAAFSFMCYTSNDILTYISMSAGWVTLSLLLAWCTSTSFETRAYFHPLPVRLWKDFKRKYHGWRGLMSKLADQSSTDVEAVGEPELEHGP
ncbi:hypothetical protein BDZ94DRAFT_913657 [Collybia nuda]|uniref:Uncharacterized protein n=1 Tax=Collybia nuda TaxID=64659 RepID=A0A9P5YD73_9AGAR|nr:hypothetical protein BDZ94DRAFT_913657 [Collybia nuda]